MEMMKLIGIPTKVKTQQTENRHEPGVIDTVYELAFDGLDIGIYDTRGKEILLYQRITSPKHKVKYELNVGVSKRKIIDVLGRPEEEAQQELKYIYEEWGYQTVIVFNIDEDKVTAITWSFPVD